MAEQKLRIRGNVVVGAQNSISQPLYDTVSFANGSVGDQVFFQTPIGQGGKVLYDTNMKQSAEIARGQSFQLQGFSITIQDVSIKAVEITDLFTTARASCQFVILDRVNWESPLHLIPAFYNFYNSETGLATGFAKPVYNVPFVKLEKEILILGKQAFNFTIRLETALSALTGPIPITVLMHGILNRQLQ